jgi:MtrB/PioB family decaheme-associated outer membrane protein
MTRALCLALLLAASALRAQEETQSTPAATPPTGQGAERVEGPASAPSTVTNLFGNFINLNLQGTNQNNNSSKFEEYRDVPEGLGGPSLRVFGNDEQLAYLISGENLMQTDRRLYVWADTSLVEVNLLFDQIPHRLGNDAKSIEKVVANEAQGISDIIQASLQSQLEARWANPATRSQINYAYLRPLVEPLLNTPEVFDLGFTRQRAALTLGLFPASAISTTLTLFQENRDGNRSSGTSFGFGNVVETAEPVEYRTRDVRLSVEAPLLQNALILRGSIGVNQFQNRVHSYTFDNPFRVTHSTDASAYQAPGSASVNGAAFGRMALPPDNNQITAAVGGIYKLPRNSRLTASVTFGRLTQDDELVAYTTNTAILAANQSLNQPPAERFDGAIDTTGVNIAYTTRPMPGLNLTARYRLYDVDNNSERLETPGFVAFDATFQSVPRITVPYGWKTQRAEILGTYDLRIVSLEGGFRRETMDRTFRETEQTTENIFHVAADLRPFSWITWRNSFEFGDRDYDEYDQVRAESASFHEEEQVNIPGLRRFDQARRDTQRIVSMLTTSPFASVTLSANYIRYFDDYRDDAEFGLQTWRSQSFTIEADYTPSDRWNAFTFYSKDDWEGFQSGRQSGATFSTNPLDNWSARNSDRANTFGAGANFVVIPDRANLHFNGRLQTVSGYGDFESPAGGTPNVGVDIANIDDTRLVTLTGELTYRLAEAWDVGIGGWIERYRIDDALNTGTEQYLPASFFLAPNDLGYRGGAAYVRTTYRW